jgi:hypothetical protein
MITPVLLARPIVFGGACLSALAFDDRFGGAVIVSGPGRNDLVLN